MQKVTTNNQMSREEEISILQSLKGNGTYFGQFFTSADIDQMCQNIRSDFAIENNCQFMQKCRFYKDQFNALCNDIINALPPFGTPEDIYDIIEVRWGIKNIIRAKHEKGLPLTDGEVEHLVNSFLYGDK